MAVLADYLVIETAQFLLRIGGTTAAELPEVSFNFVLPSGVVFDRGHPLLHYRTHFVPLPGTQSQMEIAVDVNGIEITRQFFVGQHRDTLVEAIVNPFLPGRPGQHFGTLIPRPSVFHLGGASNTIRFRPFNPTNSTENTISVASVVLWFQRDSSSQD